MIHARSLVVVVVASLASVCSAAVPSVPARLWASKIGITTDVAAAADLSSAEAAAVLGRLADASASRAQLSSAEASLSQLRKQRVQAEKPDSSSPQSVSSLGEQIAAAEVQRNNAENTLFIEVTQDLPASKIALLENARANKKRSFGAEFKIAQWTDEEAIDLERALSREKVVSSTGETLDEASAQTLTQARGKPGVSAASAALQTRRSELETVFTSAAAIAN